MPYLQCAALPAVPRVKVIRASRCAALRVAWTAQGARIKGLFTLPFCARKPNDRIRESRYDPCADTRCAALALCDERHPRMAVGERCEPRVVGKRERRGGAG